LSEQRHFDLERGNAAAQFFMIASDSAGAYEGHDREHHHAASRTQEDQDGEFHSFVSGHGN